MGLLIGALIVLAVQSAGLAAVRWLEPQDWTDVRDGWIVTTFWWALGPYTAIEDSWRRRRRIRAARKAARKAAQWHEPRPEVIP